MEPENNLDQTADIAETGDTKEESMFTALEARILGALMEKQLTTPDGYPLSLNKIGRAHV